MSLSIYAFTLDCEATGRDDLYLQVFIDAGRLNQVERDDGAVGVSVREGIEERNISEVVEVNQRMGRGQGMPYACINIGAKRALGTNGRWVFRFQNICISWSQTRLKCDVHT